MSQIDEELSNLVSPFDYRYLNLLGHLTLKIFPHHKVALFNNFRDFDREQMSLANDISANILQISGQEIEEYIEAYKWTCQLMIESEIYFRRNKKHLHDNVDSVLNSIYNDEEKSKKYLRGLLLSQILWRQQFGPTFVYSSFFLRSLNSSSSNAGIKFLEIGPGHGLWLGMASRHLKFAELFGWDISEQAITQTKLMLAKQVLQNKLTLEIVDISSHFYPQNYFDAIVVSQVLEIVPDLNQAVENITNLLSDGGQIFINVPIKSVSPDHIRSWESDKEVDKLFSSQKLVKIKSWRFTTKKSDNIELVSFTYSAVFKKKTCISREMGDI